ncbi:nuclear transport factor 2 family protein [Luteibacter aegosomatissinici]|uniref:nuclear transport factor 2 family protein n=1 Tax=Luteibacter aegosomatissinici TaxID=2911539 RepID=UPI001FFB2F4C|nr:nuclear transport factor 2 family protein [Luteibacter aegosomatissinici]UPG94160.1 nuclear transport factor 2 family protein [Luteibacter aegosomatissinici]
MKTVPLMVALALIAGPAAAADTSKAEIEKVVSTFQGALKAHDGKTLGGLFVPESSWIEALGPEGLKTVHAKKPDAPRYHTSTPGKFADFVGNNTSSLEERFHDVRIETDGAVGIVYFDFEFLLDGKVQNRGAETWQMVRTDDGWKIAAMLYSSNF